MSERRDRAPSHGSARPSVSSILLVLGFLALLILPRMTRGTSPLLSKEAPSFQAPALQQGAAPISLAELRGKVVLLDFWAPWCGPCKQEMPELERLARKLASDGVVVLGVLADDDLGGALAVLRRLQISYPQVNDSSRRIAHDYSIASFPTLLILDRQGIVRSVFVGYTTEADLESSIRPLL